MLKAFGYFCRLYKFTDSYASQFLRRYMQKPAVTVIISVYNKWEWVELVLVALEIQSFTDFEVVIADDGSSAAFVDALKRYSAVSPLSIQHVWHEDKGFRKTRILNGALKTAKGDYLIFIDGDCVPDRHFVADHWHNRQADTILAGRRVNLSPAVTTTVTGGRIREGYLSSPAFYGQVWLDNFRKRGKHAEKSVRLPRFLHRLLPEQSRGILGCNFSLHRDDLLGINGFDMRYEAPAFGEDTDIDVRLRWQGKKVKLLKFQAVQYHLYHKKLERASGNDKIFAEVLEKKQAVTPYGLNEL